MAAIATETARHPLASGEIVSGALLASGAAALFVGTLFYARLTPALGLPALPAERTQALADALRLGPQALALAGGFAFLGDCLLLAACIALTSRQRRAGDLDAAGWALMAVSVALAMVFDSMTAALFFPLAHSADPAPFVAIKSWFDFLFAAGNVPYGLGFIAVLCADIRRSEPLLPRLVSYVGIVIGAAAAISGLGAAIGVLHLPLVIGLSVTFGCVILAALGLKIARNGPAVVL
ncbi:MAG: hypothetical protein WCF81_04525 [Roseiarcus sp.]